MNALRHEYERFRLRTRPPVVDGGVLVAQAELDALERAWERDTKPIATDNFPEGVTAEPSRQGWGHT